MARKNRNSFDFRSLIDPTTCRNAQSRKIYEQVRSSGKIPEIYRVKGLADNSDWLKLVHECIFQWPSSCSLDDKTKELVGLAKSIAYLWEPGVLTNIEGALDAGAASDEIVEAILVASTISGLAEVETVVCVASAKSGPSRSPVLATRDGRIQRIHGDVAGILGSVPRFYASKLMVENPDWLAAIHRSTKIQYDSGVLDRKTKALVCLAASAAKRWERGIREHLGLSLKFGATTKETADVLASIYKTVASISMQIGFGVPCSVPEISGYRLLKDYFPEGRHQPRRRKVRSR